MKRKVSFIVDPRDVLPEGEVRGAGWYTFRSSMSMMREYMYKMCMEVPDRPYKVTYTVAPKHGLYKCVECSFGCFLQPRGAVLWYEKPIICQLPVEWDGLLVNRKVVVL